MTGKLSALVVRKGGPSTEKMTGILHSEGFDCDVVANPGNKQILVQRDYDLVVLDGEEMSHEQVTSAVRGIADKGFGSTVFLAHLNGNSRCAHAGTASFSITGNGGSELRSTVRKYFGIRPITVWRSIWGTVTDWFWGR